METYTELEAAYRKTVEDYFLGIWFIERRGLAVDIAVYCETTESDPFSVIKSLHLTPGLHSPHLMMGNGGTARYLFEKLC